MKYKKLTKKELEIVNSLRPELQDMAITLLRKPKKNSLKPVVKKKSQRELYYEQFPITDYHDFSYRGTPKEKRRKLDIGDIYLNAAICTECDYFIRSRNRHDMVDCKCGAISVDGGSWYQKLRGADKAISVIEMYDDWKEKEDEESEPNG